MPKIVFLRHCYLDLRSMSKVRVKVKGEGQLFGAQRSILGARLCRVQQRAIGVITSLQVFVYVSVISGHMRVNARRR